MMSPSPDFLRQLDTPAVPFSASSSPSARGQVLYADASGRFRFRFAGLVGSGSASFLHYTIEDYGGGKDGRAVTYSVYVRLVSDPRPSDERVRKAVLKAFRELGSSFTVDINL